MPSKPTKDQNDSSNSVISIDALAYKAQISKLEEENKNLTKQNIGYSQTVDQLLKQLEEKSNVIKQLETMLMSVTPVIGEVSPLIRSTEQIIIDFQIEKFKDAAMLRSLTLDETRQLDLLIKNKRLLDGNATEIPGKAKSLKDEPHTKLLEMAKQPLKTE